MTDRRQLSANTADVNSERHCLLRQARCAVEAAIDILQIRERDLDGAALATLVSAIVAIARGSRTRIVVNDRIDVAVACGAAGVHLRADSPPPSLVRRMAPRGFLIGRSVHDAAEAAAAGDVDYLIAGTVWPTSSKPAGHPLLGESGLGAVVRAAHVPVLAIGGVTLERLAAVRRAGAAGIAAIGLFMSPGASEEARTGASCRAVPLLDLVETARTRFDAAM